MLVAHRDIFTVAIGAVAGGHPNRWESLRHQAGGLRHRRDHVPVAKADWKSERALPTGSFRSGAHCKET